MSVCIVVVAGRVNAVFRQRANAEAHVSRLREVNGDQLAVQIMELEVRDA